MTAAPWRRFRPLVLVALVVIAGGCCSLPGASPRAGGDALPNSAASQLAAQNGDQAVTCARRFAEANWQSGSPAEIGDASLVACDAALQAFSAATTGSASGQGILAVGSAGSGTQNGRPEAYPASEATTRKRMEMRAAAIRRALELQRAAPQRP